MYNGREEATDTLRHAAAEKHAPVRRSDETQCMGKEGVFNEAAKRRREPDGGWKLHDRKKAERIYVDFDSVPLGGLYYVKGVSRGEQNRTFLYENGEVVWY